MKEQLTQAQALALVETKWWLDSSHKQIAMFQMFTDRLCCPFSVFHEALEKTLGRPVFTHEMALDREGIQAELRGERPAPSFDEILSLIPADKLIVIGIDP